MGQPAAHALAHVDTPSPRAKYSRSTSDDRDSTLVGDGSGRVLHCVVGRENSSRSWRWRASYQAQTAATTTPDWGSPSLSRERHWMHCAPLEWLPGIRPFRNPVWAVTSSHALALALARCFSTQHSTRAKPGQSGTADGGRREAKQCGVTGQTSRVASQNSCEISISTFCSGRGDLTPRPLAAMSSAIFLRAAPLDPSELNTSDGALWPLPSGSQVAPDRA